MFLDGNIKISILLEHVKQFKMNLKSKYYKTHLKHCSQVFKKGFWLLHIDGDNF